MAFGFLAILVATSRVQLAEPALWLNLRGDILVDGRAVKPRFTPGAARIQGPNGTSYSFSGQRGGILFPDLENFHLGQSITVSTWINAKSYVNDGPGAQILFRGDDRSGLDPFTLVVQSDGTINFGISDENFGGTSVKAELPLNRWIHVTATFSAKTGWMAMYLDGEKVATSRTSKRQFTQLDPNWTPGLSIGNVQNDRGPHNQPFNGVLADVRLYREVLDPVDAGYNPALIGHQSADRPQ